MLRAYTMVHAAMQATLIPELWRERLKRLQTIPM